MLPAMPPVRSSGCPPLHPHVNPSPSCHSCVFQGLTLTSENDCCELLDDGSTNGFLQYAMMDRISLSSIKIPFLIAMDNVANIIRRAWEANRHELQYQKNWLKKQLHCLVKEIPWSMGKILKGQVKTRGTLVATSSELVASYVTVLWFSF